MKKTKLKNCKIILEDKVIDDGCLIIDKGKIDSVHAMNISLSDCVELDLNGYYVSPGFIDVHCHGGVGYDFMDGDTHGLVEIAKHHAIHGTTTLFPTSMTSSMDEISQFLNCFKELSNTETSGADLPGIHLEGPFLSSEKADAQDANHLCEILEENYLFIFENNSLIKRVSIAPELDGAFDLSLRLTKHNIIPSIAHTNCNYGQVVEASRHGFTFATHLYSGMNSIQRVNGIREAGAVEACLNLEDIAVEIIADGKHLPSEVIELVYKLKGADKICLVTDAMRASGTNSRESILGNNKTGSKVLIRNNVAMKHNGTCLAGSIATYDAMVRFLYSTTNIPLTEIIRMSSTTPAAIFGLGDRGRLEKGYRADIVVFDENIKIQKVFVQGELIHDCFNNLNSVEKVLYERKN